MSKNSKLVKIAKRLRQNMTKAERMLWEELRNKKLGVKFRRQMPLVFGVYRFIADFYCASRKLVIEVDGGIHDDPEVRKIDKIREDIIREMGYRIIRIKNKDIETDLKKVIDNINKALKSNN